MFIVAIATLATTAEVEAQALAADLGIAAYDARMLVTGVLPAIVLVTADREQAAALAKKMRVRGHAIVNCSTDDVVSSRAMITMRQFHLEPDGVTTDDRPGERLGYDDVFAMLRATHRHEVEVRNDAAKPKKEKKSSNPVQSLAPKAEPPATLLREEHEQLLYLFRTSGATPWVLRERGTHFAGLGNDLAPARFENFMTTMRLLREAMPRAAFDDRLLAVRRVGARELRATSALPWIANATPLEATLDLLAHLLAQWISARTGDPYRG